MIKPRLKKLVTIGLAGLLFGYGALFSQNFGVEAQWILGSLLVLGLILHCVLPRKWARWWFCVWLAITSFFIMWSMGYELTMWQYSNCDEQGEHCVMPIAQLLVGLILAIIGELFVLWKLRRFSQPKWELIWQISMFVGLLVGAIGKSF